MNVSFRWLLLLFVIIASSVKTSFATEECENDAAKPALISREELSSKTGENNSKIWLSILGEVYDVSLGAEYYGPGEGYNSLTARDGSVPFITGVFTSEEAEKDIDTLSEKDLPGLVEWQKFYEEHEIYTFVGYLVDPRFYDENGDPHRSLLAARERIAAAINTEQKVKKIR